MRGADVDWNDAWNGYFQTLAGVSATLLGLAVVAFQLHPENWAKDPLRHPVAVLSLTELAGPLFFSLMVMFPAGHRVFWNWLPDQQGYIVAGWIVGVFGGAVIAWHLVAYLREKERQSFDHWQMGGDIISVYTFGVMLAPVGLEWKAAVAVWMCFSGIVEAWVYFSVPGRSTTST